MRVFSRAVIRDPHRLRAILVEDILHPSPNWQDDAELCLVTCRLSTSTYATGVYANVAALAP